MEEKGEQRVGLCYCSIAVAAAAAAAHITTILIAVYGLKLNATVFLQWDVHQITQIFLNI
jgi:hypothetical protein